MIMKFDYEKEIKKMLKIIETEKELPEDSLIMEEQDNKNKGEYLVMIFEPEYPEDKNAQVRKGVKTSALIIKEEHLKKENKRGKKDFLKVRIKPYLVKKFPIPENAELVGRERNEDEDYQDIRFDIEDKSIVDYVRKVMTYKAEHYMSKESFGCCSKHVQCSDALKCLHENKLYATGCSYRMHLEKGEIFYGNNRNVE